MHVTISARQCVVPGPVRRHTEERLRRLTRFEPRLHGAEVNFEVEGGVHRAEARVIVPGAPLMVARGQGATFRVAVDRATDRLRRRLKNKRGRLRNHPGARSSPEMVPAGG